MSYKTHTQIFWFLISKFSKNSLFIIIYFSYLHMKTFYRTTISTLIIHSFCRVSILKGLKLQTFGPQCVVKWYRILTDTVHFYRPLNIFSCFQYSACWLTQSSDETMMEVNKVVFNYCRRQSVVCKPVVVFHRGPCWHPTPPNQISLLPLLYCLAVSVCLILNIRQTHSSSLRVATGYERSFLKLGVSFFSAGISVGGEDRGGDLGLCPSFNSGLNGRLLCSHCEVPWLPFCELFSHAHNWFYVHTLENK